MAKPSAGGRRPRKRQSKNVTHGVAHIKSSFNNTIISITDQRGDAVMNDCVSYCQASELPQCGHARRAAGAG